MKKRETREDLCCLTWHWPLDPKNYRYTTPCILFTFSTPLFRRQTARHKILWPAAGEGVHRCPMPYARLLLLLHVLGADDVSSDDGGLTHGRLRPAPHLHQDKLKCFILAKEHQVPKHLRAFIVWNFSWVFTQSGCIIGILSGGISERAVSVSCQSLETIESVFLS